MNGGVTNEGIQGRAGVLAGGEASAKGSAYVGPLGVYGRAEGLAGAEASANAGVGVDGIHVGAETFAGAKGGIAGGADVGGIAAGATAEGWAGPGAEASLNFGKDANGAWHFAPKVGVSPIIGGAVGFEVTVDPGKVVDTANSAADVVGDTAGWVADEVSSLF